MAGSFISLNFQHDTGLWTKCLHILPLHLWDSSWSTIRDVILCSILCNWLSIKAGSVFCFFSQSDFHTKNRNWWFPEHSGSAQSYDYKYIQVYFNRDLCGIRVELVPQSVNEENGLWQIKRAATGSLRNTGDAERQCPFWRWNVGRGAQQVSDLRLHTS